MRVYILLLLIIFNQVTYAQYSRYIVELKDKKGTQHSIINPTTFLSVESIARKKRYNISIDSTDLPVSNAYIDSIKSLPDVGIVYTSRWLNLVIIQTTNSTSLNTIRKFNFVKTQYPIATARLPVKLPTTDEEIVDGAFTSAKASPKENILSYGKSLNQISIHEGEFLHNLGFQGKGVKVALFDGGFYKYLNYPAFDSLRKKNGIKVTWDFVNNDPNVNDDDTHGMSCLSIMAANLPGVFVGTSPSASYYLFRTEDSRSEYPIEEANWLIAAERADSIGIDLISSSLGYTTFDDPYFNHQYSDMNGIGTLSSKAASIAVSKGMIVTNSAGNEGNDPWKYISAPSDGIHVLSVGAIGSDKRIAPFSSYGPSADGRVKPDIISVGWNTQLIAGDGNVGIGSGTSFSNPNIAGLIACLWQAFPEFTNLEIIDALIKSSDQYASPDNRRGYGIPNMRLAYLALENERNIRNAKRILTDKRILVYPNPFSSDFKIAYKAPSTGLFSWNLLNNSGQVLRSSVENVKKDEYYIFKVDQLDMLSKGIYFIHYSDDLGKSTIQIIK